MADISSEPIPSVTVLGADQFDALVDNLDEPDDAPALAEAFARPRQFHPAAEEPSP